MVSWIFCVSVVLCSLVPRSTVQSMIGEYMPSFLYVSDTAVFDLCDFYYRSDG
jgi:hypothetical protein